MRQLFFAAWAVLACQSSPTAISRPGEQKPISERAVAQEAAAEGPLLARGLSSLGRRSSASPARRELSWRLAAEGLGDIPVVVSAPPDLPPDVPVLILLHGRGESLKGPERGARGWLEDYGLLRTLSRLKSPPLSPEDFGGTVTSQELAKVNAVLAAAPFREFVLVMPYVPNAFGRGELFDNGARMGAFIETQVLPRVRSELGVVAGPHSTAIDGVSLGGRVALAAGVSVARAFANIGATQAALDETELDALVERMKHAREVNPALRFRLLTSHEDYFLGVNRDLSSRLAVQGVRHTLDIVQGDHSYAFNRGPGAIGLLLYHERTLWGAPQP